MLRHIQSSYEQMRLKSQEELASTHDLVVLLYILYIYKKKRKCFINMT